MALASHWHYNLALVYVDCMPIGPLHFIFFFFLIKSKLFSNNSLLLLRLNELVLSIGKLVSKGMTAFAP